MSDAERRTLLVDGTESLAGVQGSGGPCLYLHSEFGETIDHPALDQLSESGYRVFAPVLPGFGPGPVPDWDDISHAVFWLRCLCDALDLQQDFTLIGSGLGGWLAAELAVWFPERINRLILIGAPGLRIEGCAVAELFREGLPPLSPLVLPSGGQLEDLIPPRDMPDLDARRLHLLRALEATARVAWAPYFYDPKLADRLVHISCPTLVVWGERDLVVPLAHGEEYAHRTGGRLEVVAGAGHLPLLERPDETLAVIKTSHTISGQV